jgi:hypothetical protein
MWPFLWSILELIINLRTFDEGLSNKKHVQILECLKKTSPTNVLCMTKYSNNIVKWLQIHRSPISWAPKHNYKLWINNSLNTINGDFPK